MATPVGDNHHYNSNRKRYNYSTTSNVKSNVLSAEIAELGEFVRHSERLQWAIVSIFFGVTLFILKSTFYNNEVNYPDEYPLMSLFIGSSIIIFWAVLSYVYHEIAKIAGDIFDIINNITPASNLTKDIGSNFSSPFHTPIGVVIISSFSLFFIISSCLIYESCSTLYCIYIA